MNERNTLVVWIGIFLTTTSVAWAVAIATIYGPPEPQRTAKEICALALSSKQNTPFCMEIAKQNDAPR